MIDKKLLNEYKDFCYSTAVYPGVNTGSETEILYLALGLYGEYEEWKRSYDWRNRSMPFNPKEASDVCWYVMRLCDVFNWDYNKVFNNVETHDESNTNIFEQLKKFIRDGKDIKTTLYISCLNKICLLHEYHCISTIIKINMDKLTERKNTNTLQGDGETVEERIK